MWASATCHSACWATCHPLTGFPFSLRERARIQGFPDDFIFYSEKVDDKGEWCHEDNIVLVRQTGKAMPVQFCRYVSEQIRAHVEGRSFESSRSRIIKPHPHVDEAKRWYCENVGYADKEHVCSACWKSAACLVVKQERLFPLEVKQPDSFSPEKARRAVVRARPHRPFETKTLTFGGTDGD